MKKTKARAPKAASALPAAPRDLSIPDVGEEDEVAIKDWCFLPNGVRMQPIELYKIGWPNRFRVIDSKDMNGRRMLKLDPCCNWMEDHENGNFRCEWHPAECFIKIDEAKKPERAEPAATEDSRTPHPEDRYTSLDTPWGEVIKVEFLDDERVPVIKLRFAGGRSPFVVSGEIARFMKDRAVELGFL